MSTRTSHRGVYNLIILVTIIKLAVRSVAKYICILRDDTAHSKDNAPQPIHVHGQSEEERLTTSYRLQTSGKIVALFSAVRPVFRRVGRCLLQG